MAQPDVTHPLSQYSLAGTVVKPCHAGSSTMAFMCTNWWWLIPTIPVQVSHMDRYVLVWPWKLLWFPLSRSPSLSPLNASKSSSLVGQSPWEVTTYLSHSPWANFLNTYSQTPFSERCTASMPQNMEIPKPCLPVICCVALWPCPPAQDSHTHVQGLQTPFVNVPTSAPHIS